MPKVQTRLPCPVCLGTTLRKVEIGARRQLVLDYCARCGGIWFERGEVNDLRQRDPRALWAQLDRRPGSSRMSCHSCHAVIERNATSCSACGWENRLECPTCARPMTVRTHEGLRLDVCERCHGVWFDHEELESVWRLNVEASMARRRAGLAVRDEGADIGLLYVLAYSPDLIFYGAQAAGHTVSGAAHLISDAPELAVTAVEGAGEAAEGIFGAVVEIISGIFDGF